jgi:hypothetical protein
MEVGDVLGAVEQFKADHVAGREFLLDHRLVESSP